MAADEKIAAVSHIPPRIWQRLRLAAEEAGNAPIILTGNNENALSGTADAFAQILLCERYQWGSVPAPACRECHACHLVATGNHPDLITLNTPSATVTVKDIHHLFESTRLTPAGKRRVLVMHNIEKASLPAANALLKSLEEPQPTTTIILTTPFPRRLLTTLRSRCSLIALPTVMSEKGELGSVDTLSLGELTDDRLQEIGLYLENRLRTHGPSPDIKRAYARLRDYYVISRQRGNKKLAGEVLLLSLPQ